MLQRILFSLGGAAVLSVLLWAGYNHIEQRGYDRCKTELQAATEKLAIAYADRVMEAEGERDANQAIVDRLSIQLNKLQIHICPAIPPAENPNGTTGLLPNRVDESFADLQTRATVLFERCDELNLDAIKLNAVTP